MTIVNDALPIRVHGLERPVRAQHPQGLERFSKAEIDPEPLQYDVAIGARTRGRGNQTRSWCIKGKTKRRGPRLYLPLDKGLPSAVRTGKDRQPDPEGRKDRNKPLLFSKPMMNN